MILPVTTLIDLSTVLDRLPQKDFPTLKDVRQCVGCVEQIRKAVKDPIEDFDSAREEVAEFMKPYQDRITKAKDDKERDRINKEANEKGKPLADKIAELNKKYREEEQEIELDENYRQFLKTHFNDKIRPNYLDAKEVIKIADALEL